MLSLLKDRNPDDVYRICKTDNQFPLKYHNQSSEILPVEDYGNKTLDFDDVLESKEAKDIDAYFTRGRHQNRDKFYISQSWYELPENTFRKICSRNMLFPKSQKRSVRSITISQDYTCVFQNSEFFVQRHRKKDISTFKSIKINI